MPRLFKAFPSAKDNFASFAVRKLATLTIEEVNEFTSTVLIPNLIIEWNDDKDTREECASQATQTPVEDGLQENEENDKIMPCSETKWSS